MSAKFPGGGSKLILSNPSTMFALDCWYQFGDKVQGQPDGAFRR